MNIDQYHNAREMAFRFLQKKLRTEYEVRLRLKTHFPQDTIDKVIEKLKESELLNDEKYVECFIRDRLKLNPWGKNRIKMELKRKGINPSCIEKTHEYQNINEINIITEIINKKMKQYNLNDVTNRKKLMDYLYRRGFELDYIHEALNNFTD